MFFLFTCKLYLKWSKFLCNFTARVRIETTGFAFHHSSVLWSFQGSKKVLSGSPKQVVFCGIMCSYTIVKRLMRYWLKTLEYLLLNLKITVERSKRGSFLTLIFTVKSMWKNLMIRSNLFSLLTQWARVQVSPLLTKLLTLWTLRVIGIKFLLVISMLCIQSDHKNYRRDHTRWICLIFYQLLPTTSVGNK